MQRSVQRPWFYPCFREAPLCARAQWWKSSALWQMHKTIIHKVILPAAIINQHRIPLTALKSTLAQPGKSVQALLRQPTKLGEMSQQNNTGMTLSVTAVHLPLAMPSSAEGQCPLPMSPVPKSQHQVWDSPPQPSRTSWEGAEWIMWDSVPVSHKANWCFA